MKPTQLALACLLLAACGIASADSRDFGDHVVHYHAMPTRDLNAKVAQQYGLRQEPGRVMLMVTVRKKDGTVLPPAVAAALGGKIRDLLGNRQDLSFREVREASSVDYLAEVVVKDSDTRIFDLTVDPEGGNSPLRLSFAQQFFVD